MQNMAFLTIVLLNVRLLSKNMSFKIVTFQ